MLLDIRNMIFSTVVRIRFRKILMPGEDTMYTTHALDALTILAPLVWVGIIFGVNAAIA